MKKKMIALLAGALMTVAMAGNALAYFEQDHLIRVVYDKSINAEVATDLGKVQDIITAAKNGPITLGGGVDSYLSGSLAGSSYSNLNVAYFAINMTNKDLWLSSKAAAENSLGQGWTATSGAMVGLQNLYATKITSGATATYDMTKTDSYNYKMNGNGTKTGNFNTWLKTGNGEMNLAALAAGGEVMQKLFFFDTANTAGSAGKAEVKIKTLSGGATEVSNVPVPPALFLMGSGLLGLVGIRRKKQ